jgi:hypothetical protein
MFLATKSDRSFVYQPSPKRKPRFGYENTLEGFDPGSERTLAAWIRHASRTNPVSHPALSRKSEGAVRDGGSGERGSNAWVTYPGDGDSLPNGRVIPGDSAKGHPYAGK